MQHFAPRTSSGKRTKASRDLFCSQCVTRLGSGFCCAHFDCNRPCAPTRLGKGPHRFCTHHLADPANEVTRSWSACVHKGQGYKFLSVKPNSGKCFACSNSYLPCENAPRGCPRHVQHDPHSRTRRSCTGHGKTACPFSDATSYRRCSSMFCSNSRDSLSDALCSTCRKGFLPCTSWCSRRTRPNQGPQCTFCSSVNVGNSAAALAGISNLQCATPGCSTLAWCKFQGAYPHMVQSDSAFKRMTSSNTH